MLKTLRNDVHPKDILMPNMSTIRLVIMVESLTSFNASSSLQVVAKPSPAASKLAQGYRDFRMPRVRLADSYMFTRMIS
jgi:hypothetical protein